MVGNRTRVKVVKNKCAPPFRQAEFDIMYGKGISREGSVIDLGVELGIVKKSGAWYTYEGEQLGQGREKAKEFLIDNPELMVEITDKVMRKAGIGLDGEVTSRPKSRPRPRWPTPRREAGLGDAGRFARDEMGKGAGGASPAPFLFGLLCSNGECEPCVI